MEKININKNAVYIPYYPEGIPKGPSAWGPVNGGSRLFSGNQHYRQGEGVQGWALPGWLKTQTELPVFFEVIGAGKGRVLLKELDI